MVVLAVNIALNFVAHPAIGHRTASPRSTSASALAQLACCSIASSTAAAISASPAGWSAASSRQLVAGAAMAAALCAHPAAPLADLFFGSVGRARRSALGALVGAAGWSISPSPGSIGGIDKEAIAHRCCRRKKPKQSEADSRCASFPASSPPATSTSAISSARSALGADAGRGRVPVLPRRPPRDDLDADPAAAARQRLEMAAALVACGIDPAKSILFNQAHVPAHAELLAAQRHRADGLAEPHDPVQGQVGQEPRRRQRRPVRPIRCCRRPTCCSTRRPMCRSARTRSSISSWRATSRRSSTTISTSSCSSSPEPFIPAAAARIMSLRDGSAKMSKSDPSDMSRINLTDDDEVDRAEDPQGQDRPRAAARRTRRARGAARGAQPGRHLSPRWPARAWRAVLAASPARASARSSRRWPSAGRPARAAPRAARSSCAATRRELDASSPTAPTRRGTGRADPRRGLSRGRPAR